MIASIELFDFVPNFHLWELRCRGTGALPPARMLTINAFPLAVRLQRMRDVIGAPIIIKSWYRTGDHNDEVGGSPDSLHLQARAVDCLIPSLTQEEIYEFAIKSGFTGIGVYPHKGHVHLDDRLEPLHWFEKKCGKNYYIPYDWHGFAENFIVELGKEWGDGDTR